MNVMQTANLFDCEIESCTCERTWKESRKNGIGASESATIFGVGYADSSPMAIWAEKVHGIREEPTGDFLRLLNRGKKMEPVIASEFQAEMPEIGLVDPGDFTIFRSREFPFMFATLDRIAIDSDRGPIPLELKNISGRNWQEWESDQPPLKYIVQCQHQMSVTNTTACYLAALIGGERLDVRLIERNDKFIKVMVERLREFWSLVERKKMPQIDDSEATGKAIAKIYPADTGAEIQLAESFGALSDELEQIKEEIKSLESEKTGIENQIKAAIGDATVGVLPFGKGKFSWKRQERKGYTVAPSESRVLRKLKG